MWTGFIKKIKNGVARAQLEYVGKKGVNVGDLEFVDVALARCADGSGDREKSRDREESEFAHGNSRLLQLPQLSPDSGAFRSWTGVGFRGKRLHRMVRICTRLGVRLLGGSFYECRRIVPVSVS